MNELCRAVSKSPLLTYKIIYKGAKVPFVIYAAPVRNETIKYKKQRNVYFSVKTYQYKHFQGEALCNQSGTKVDSVVVYQP